MWFVDRIWSCELLQATNGLQSGFLAVSLFWRVFEEFTDSLSWISFSWIQFFWILFSLIAILLDPIHCVHYASSVWLSILTLHFDGRHFDSPRSLETERAADRRDEFDNLLAITRYPDSLDLFLFDFFFVLKLIGVLRAAAVNHRPLDLESDRLTCTHRGVQVRRLTLWIVPTGMSEESTKIRKSATFCGH